MAGRDDFESAMYERMTELAKSGSPTTLLKLAEAQAWLLFPNNSHGGDVTVSK